MRRKVINIVFVLIVYKFKAIAAIVDDTCQLNRDMENQCRTYSYTVVKPMLDYLRQVEEELQQSKEKDKIIANLRRRLEKQENNDDLVNELRSQIQVQKVFDTNSKLIENYGKCKDEFAEISKKLESEVDKLNSKLSEKEKDIDFHKKRFDNLHKSFEDFKKRQNKCQTNNLKNCESQLKTLNSSLIEKVENTSDLQVQIDLHKQTIDKLRIKSEDCDKYREESGLKSKNLEICKVQLKELNSSLIEKVENTSRYNVEIENCNKYQNTLKLQLEEKEAKFLENQKEFELCAIQVKKLNVILARNFTPSDCIAFGQTFEPQLVRVNDKEFLVLCDGVTMAPGWLVIHHRYASEMNVDFNGNWTSYREGFGSFDKNFFLGLEKIHLLTRFKNELYVEFFFQNNTWGHAQYSSIEVSDEKNNYTLSLGKFSGQSDILGSFNSQVFSTYDHGNHQNCAREKGIGWWHPSCDSSNLNDKPEFDYSKITRMLIRPTYEFFDMNN